MFTTRRRIGVAAASICAAAAFALTPAAADDAADLSNAIESLRKATFSADKAALEALLDDNITYGHSSNKVENKAEVIAGMTGRKSVMKTLKFADQKNAVHGPIGTSRHFYESESEQDGKMTTTRIGILQVWHKQDGKWKLVARQGFKL